MQNLRGKKVLGSAPPGVLNFYEELVYLRPKNTLSFQPVSIVNNKYIQQAAVSITQPSIHAYGLGKIIILNEA